MIKIAYGLNIIISIMVKGVCLMLGMLLVLNLHRSLPGSKKLNVVWVCGSVKEEEGGRF